MTDASSADRNSSRHIQSARSRLDLLDAHVEHAAPIDARLLDGCRSQGALAQVEALDLGIVPMSLNTLKAVSDDYLTGGFAELDRLRRIAARTMLKSAPKTSSERSASSPPPEQSEHQAWLEQRQKLVDSCAFMADQYNDLLATYRRALDRLDKGRANPENERRLLDVHLKRFRGPRAQPLTLVSQEAASGPRHDD